MIKFYNAILKVRKWKRLAESFFDPRLHLIINGMLCPRILPDMYFSIQFYSAHSEKKIIQSLAKRPGRIYLFLWQEWVAVQLIKFDWVFAIRSIVIKSVVVLSNVYVDEIALIA